MPDPEDVDDRFEEQRESTPNASGPQGAAGGMGVSSERVGHVGPNGREGTDGARGAASAQTQAEDDAPTEQSAGGREENPEGIAPKSGYSSEDPRADDEV